MSEVLEGNDIESLRIELAEIERNVSSSFLSMRQLWGVLHLQVSIGPPPFRVGLELPTVEVRYQNLSVEAECQGVHGIPSPLYGIPSRVSPVSPSESASTRCKCELYWNNALYPKHNISVCVMCNVEQAIKNVIGHSTRGSKIKILRDVSGIIKPSRMTLLLGPPGCGKTTLLLALSGKLDQTLKHVVRALEAEQAIAIEGLKRTLQTDYVLKILGLDTCADTIVGDAMRRGISGGQKKRLTTGEIIIGPAKVMLTDEVSTGLDSSTTFQIVTCLQQWTHITGSTIVVSLLQPAPETFNLFDDIVMMAEGKTVYHGPRNNVLELFEKCGFRCPPRKGIADFLQEVVSKKDQAQYWCHMDKPYNYVSVEELGKTFKEFHHGQKLDEELSQPFHKSEFSKSAMSFNIYSLRKWELFKACMAREWLLMKRNSFVHVFKSTQLVVIALVTMTVFIRTRMSIDVIDANYYMGSLFFALIRLMCNGIQELSMTVSRLAVFYKQRDSYFYPAWTYSIPAVILKIPFSFLDAFLWTALSYYVIGYSPEPEASLPAWLEWGSWLSPLTYAQIGASVNEFLAPRWQKVGKKETMPLVSSSNTTIGQKVLTNRGLNYDGYFYWISMGALLGFWIVFNIGFTFALSCLKPPGRSQTLISHERLSELRRKKSLRSISQENNWPGATPSRGPAKAKQIGMVLPFKPVIITFENVQYFVNTPKKMREQGFKQKRLQLLQDITGAFRPGVLTALMGVSGAGKTTLLDVLSGRKTGGIIEGDIRIGGYPKRQATYARISGYCEQTDIRSPQITIEESLTYSAWLRLPSQIPQSTKAEFVAEVLQMIELDNLKEMLVSFPGVSGISTEQRKRLTIAVELVSNPSIVFMDEPTSGLDARAAAIVMRIVKNIVSTMRTVVCTIHQPTNSKEKRRTNNIFWRAGFRIQVNSSIILRQATNQQMVQIFLHFALVFTNIPGVPKINEQNNPATWMLEVTSPSAEALLGLDFAHLYKESHLYRYTKELAKELSSPAEDAKELHFSTSYAQNGWEQFKACLWKQHLSYWRSPKYNLVRLTFITMASLLFGAILWRKGKNIERFAGMYSSWAYSFAQMTIEIPYIFLQAALFVIITYPAIDFYCSEYKIFWYFYTMFSTLLYFTYLGMLLVSITPNFQVASVLASFCYTMLNLFSGFLIPGPRIPKWWVWCYWICPTAWSLRGLLTSQYGDIDKEIIVFGERKAINSFLQSYFGFRRDFQGVVAFLLISFPLVSVFCFTYSMAKLNFQRR
ncbi:hypothetical protein RJ639_047594 [Escallonia herrerae]|uniref:ABC transporter domain-containing protein n=1 Tax=Escallonia herrerae TaxID=1293975 RepID=A0AA89B1F4_9ASTE|nr:hypothetical protein RJ639_047594 [Escallonia herrerae]